MPKPNKNNVEKPKDFKKTFNKLLKSLKPYYVHIIVITILSIFCFLAAYNPNKCLPLL